MAAENTKIALVITVGLVLIVLGITAAVWSGVARSDNSRRRSIEICVEAGGSWISGNCIAGVGR